MKVLAVVPARGGSKGIPRKNLQLVGGRPLVAHTIRAALRAELVDAVVVSTDDPEIARAATDGGAEVSQRPADISGDSASSESTLLHVLSDGARPEVVLMLQCTSPLVRPEDIDACARAVLEGRADCAFTVTPDHSFLWRYEGDRLVAVNHDQSSRLPRQAAEPQYLETGAVYAMRTSGFVEHRHRFFGHVTGVEVPHGRAVEVDDEVDLTIARQLWSTLESADRRDLLPHRTEALVLDFDGVLTDDLVITHEDGREAVRCSRRDGLGLERLRGIGLRLLVISKERNPVVAARCEKLGLECIQSVDDKAPTLRAWAEREGIALESVVYVGNDINDIPCLAIAGCSVVVADAHPDTVAHAHFQLRAPGGHGAVRELADLILAGRA